MKVAKALCYMDTLPLTLERNEVRVGDEQVYNFGRAFQASFKLLIFPMLRDIEERITKQISVFRASNIDSSP